MSFWIIFNSQARRLFGEELTLIKVSDLVDFFGAISWQFCGLNKMLEWV